MGEEGVTAITFFSQSSMSVEYAAALRPLFSGKGQFENNGPDFMVRTSSGGGDKGDAL